jgi:transposase-like protein
MHGVSMRAVGDLVRAMGGSGVSKRQVSRLCAEIDERVRAFLTRPLEGAWSYLWLDATNIRVRENGRTMSRAVIIAVAVNEDGWREVLCIATGPSEAGRSGPVCLALPCRLRPARREARRGRRSQGAQGRRPPSVRCDPPTVSRALALGNAPAHATAKSRTAVAAMFKTISAQDTKAEAEAQWNTVADDIRQKKHRLGASAMVLGPIAASWRPGRLP